MKPIQMDAICPVSFAGVAQSEIVCESSSNFSFSSYKPQGKKKRKKKRGRIQSLNFLIVHFRHGVSSGQILLFCTWV